MPEICHRVGIAAPRHRVHEDFATKGGLVEFWTPVEGEPEVDGKLNLFFGSIAEQTEHRDVYCGQRAPRWTTSDRASCISPPLLTSRRSTWFTQAVSGRDQAGTNGRAYGLVAEMRVEVTVIAYRAR